jgi:hypothetical protein
MIAWDGYNAWRQQNQQGSVVRVVPLCARLCEEVFWC